MTFKNIAILGAGAVGSYILWGLSKKEDLNLCIIADGDRKKRFAEKGFRINDKEYFPQVKTPAEAYGVDLVVLCVKYNALPSALEDIKKIVGPNTTVMSLMNGVTSEEKLAGVIPKEQIIPSLIKVSSERDGNSIKFDPEVTIGMIYGEAESFNGINGAVRRDRMEALEELFADTGLHYRETDQIFNEIWAKFQLNISFNVPQTILGCGLGAYVDSQHGEWIVRKLCEEVVEIAAAKGITLDPEPQFNIIGSVSRKDARYSMLQDMDAKRHTEIDMFCGAIVEMGKELGIATPYNEMAYHLVKSLEDKNDGVFDY